MKIDIITLFPKMFDGPFSESIIKRAIENKLVEINLVDLRRFGEGERRLVDDKPYGGGPGMLLRVDILDNCLKSLKLERNPKTKIVLLDATGEKFNQKKALSFSKLDHLVLIAGHYEGIDHRVHEHLVDEIISIGDYVLTGGELPAMSIVDATTRLIPGVLGKDESSKEESHSSEGYLEYPQYTRPSNFHKWKVPDILLSGDHKKIKKWREDNGI